MALETSIAQYLVPCVPGATFRETMRLVLAPQHYAIDLAGPIDRNPAYSDWILRTDFLQSRIKQWMSDAPEGQVQNRAILEKIFSLLGKQASRNLIACIQLNRIQGSLPRKAKDSFTAKPQEQLKYALAAEEYCTSREYASSDMAFLGGLQFDFLLANLVRAKASRDTQAAIATQWTESLKTAGYAYEIASKISGGFNQNDKVFPAALSIGIGKVLQIAHYPKEQGQSSYGAFVSEIDKLKTGKYFAALKEESKFEFAHWEWGSLFANFFRFLEPIEKAVYFYQKPYELKKLYPDLYKVASILHLAQGMSSGLGFCGLKNEMMKDLGINEEILKKIQTKAGSK